MQIKKTSFSPTETFKHNIDRTIADDENLQQELLFIYFIIIIIIFIMIRIKAEKKIEDLKGDQNRLLLQAAKDGNLNEVDRLIQSGADTNFLDEEENTAIDHAWNRKFYPIVLLLLNADSKFPDEFNLSQLDDANEHEKDLKNFVQERNRLHNFIKDDNLEEVRAIVRKTISKYYFNCVNESARYSAIRAKNFKIYAYLKSEGAELADDYEKEILGRLKSKHKVALKDAMVRFFSPVSKPHILYLISKSKSQKLIEGLESKLQYFYLKLDDIPEISWMFQVIQHSDFLDVIFDFDEENLMGVNPLTLKNTKGETNYKEGRLYIAAGAQRGERKILGTIAHEMTHMAMQILFRNDCNPYLMGNREGKVHFDEIAKNILKSVKKMGNGPGQIISNVAKSYVEEDHHSELIVTVPQILAEHENGVEWLEGNASELYNFFKEVIIPKCQEYFFQSPELKAKYAVRNLNAASGELSKLKKLNLIFENVPSNLFNSQNSKIFVYKTRFKFLGMIKVLQGIFGENYIDLCEKYLAFSAENVVPHLKEVLQTFYMNPCDWLIVNDMGGKGFQEFLEELLEIFEHKPDKKIIFVVNPNSEAILLRMLKREFNVPPENSLKLCTVVENEDITLTDLNKESRDNILSKKIAFQGEEMLLKDLIGADENLHRLITGDVIEELLEGKIVPIGGRYFDDSNLESSYGYFYQKINTETFKLEFQNFKDIFVIKIEGSNKKEQLLACFNSDDSLFKKVNSQIYIMERIEPCEKRLILSDGLSERDIKEFCQCNPKKKIFFLEMESPGKFILHQLYDPNFYLERKFRVIVLNPMTLEREVSSYPNEIFIISKKTGANFKLKRNYNNVQVTDVAEAETAYSGYIKKEVVVHWFHVVSNDEIHWINSLNSIENLQNTVEYLKTKNQISVNENNITESLLHKKVLIIADNPGMGKTTTLTKLYESDMISKTHWIFRINLKEHVTTIKSIDFANSDPIELLTKINLKSKLGKYLLNFALNPEKKFSKCLLFAFDGFDEILDQNDRDKIILLLKYLLRNTKSKVWITTRLHYKKLLEYELSSIALEFEPLDYENQKTFIKKHLDRLKLIFDPELTYDIFEDDVKENSKMWIYIQKFLKYMEIIFNEDLSTFIGTPLQLKLLIENSVDHFRDWVKNQGNLDFSYLGKNVLEIYENFIDRKHEIYFKKQKIVEEFIKNEEKGRSEKYHKTVAESQTRDKEFGKADILMLLIGLLQSSDGSNVEFIHFTFREYFSALAFTDYMAKDRTGLDEKFKYLIAEIFLKPEYFLIRHFMNLKLTKFDIPENNLATFQKIFTATWRKKYVKWLTIPKFSLEAKRIFINTVEENNEHVLSFIFVSCESSFNKNLNLKFVTMRAEENKPILLHSAISRGNLRNSIEIFKKLETLTRKTQKEIILRKSLSRGSFVSEGSILHFAVDSGNLQVLQLVFEKLQKLLPRDDLESFLKEKVNGKNALHIASEGNHPEIVQGLLENAEKLLHPYSMAEFLMMPDAFSQTVLHISGRLGRTEILEILLRKGTAILSLEEQREFLTMTDNALETVLHVAIANGQSEIIKILLESSKKRELIMMKDEYDNTVLHLAAEHSNSKVMNILLREVKEILSQEERENIITMVNKGKRSVLHSATNKSHSEIVKILLQNCSEILPLEKLEQLIMKTTKVIPTILQSSCSRNDTETVRIILEIGLEMLSLKKQEEFITMIYEDGKTVLHKAVRFENPEIVKLLLGEKGIRRCSLEGQKKFLTANDNDSQTALHISAETGHDEIVKILLETSANLLSTEELGKYFMMEDKIGKTIFDIASDNGYVDILNEFLNKAKDITLLTSGQEEKFASIANRYEISLTPKHNRSQHRIKVTLYGVKLLDSKYIRD